MADTSCSPGIAQCFGRDAYASGRTGKMGGKPSGGWLGTGRGLRGAYFAIGDLFSSLPVDAENCHSRSGTALRGCDSFLAAAICYPTAQGCNQKAAAGVFGLPQCQRAGRFIL